MAEKPTAEAAESTASQPKRVVTLTINEPLPGLKELTAAVEDHWISMIHQAIFEESRTGIPRFEKAFVVIEITAPRGSNNPKVWDTSNRAINVIINNLKGIFLGTMTLSVWPAALLRAGEKTEEQPSVFVNWRTFWGVWFSVQKSRIYDLFLR